MTTSNPQVSLVIPVYNEEEVLKRQLDFIVPHVRMVVDSFELVIVENGSKDQTPSILKDYCQNTPELRVVVRDVADYGGALREGILQARGSVIHICQLDFFDTGFFNKSLEVLSEKNPIIIGSRNRRGMDKRPLERKILTYGLNFVLNVFFHFKGTDTHGLKTFIKQRLIRYAEECKMSRGVFDTELVLRAQYDGIEMIEFPVVAHEIRSKRNTFAQKIFRNIKDLSVMKWIFLKEGVRRK